MLFTPLSLLLVGALVGPLPDDPQQDLGSQSPIERTDPAPPVTKSTELVGSGVLDTYDGERLGTLEDVLLEGDGRLSLGLVRLAGSGALTGAPMGVLSVRIETEEDEESDDSWMASARSRNGNATTLVVCKASALLRSAPTLSSTVEIDSEWIAEVKTHFGLSSLTGSPAGGEPALLGQVLGLEVRGENEDALGSIADLALDVQAMKVRYAALRRPSLLGFGGSLHALPFTPAQLDLDKGSLLVQLDEDAVEKLPKLTDDAAWPLDATTSVAPVRTTEPQDDGGFGDWDDGGRGGWDDGDRD